MSIWRSQELHRCMTALQIPSREESSFHVTGHQVLPDLILPPSQTQLGLRTASKKRACATCSAAQMTNLPSGRGQINITIITSSLYEDKRAKTSTSVQLPSIVTLAFAWQEEERSQLLNLKQKQEGASEIINNCSWSDICCESISVSFLTAYGVHIIQNGLQNFCSGVQSYLLNHELIHGF